MKSTIYKYELTERAGLLPVKGLSGILSVKLQNDVPVAYFLIEKDDKGEYKVPYRIVFTGEDIDDHDPGFDYSRYSFKDTLMRSDGIVMHVFFN